MTLIMRKTALCKYENKRLKGICAKICAFTWVSENVRHSNSKNNGIHILSFLKKGDYHIPGGAKKGAIWHAHPYYVIYRVTLLPRQGF